MSEHSHTPENNGGLGGQIRKRLPRITLGERLSGPLGRCIFIGIITLFLQIPLGLVSDVVYERAYLSREATDEIRSSWGRDQTISGPALLIPYETWYDRKETKIFKVNGKDESRETVTREYNMHYKVVLPGDLQFDSGLQPEIRYRGIHKQAVYTAPVDMEGNFSIPPVEAFAGNDLHKIHWDKAWMAVGITDLKTIYEATPAIWNGKTLPAYKPGTNAGYLLGSGFHIAVPLSVSDASAIKNFSMKLQIRGSGGISFTPVGERTLINVKGDWTAPKFQGNLLPIKRDISETGFSAEWVISNLTRTYPQLGDLRGYDFRHKNGGEEESAITSFTAGVDLYESVSLYRMVMRAVTYGILFIAVSFVALFAFEMVTRKRMHLLQYAMVGLSMSLFYLVLLSVAEHASFGLAFIAASAVTVGMNSLYVGAALKSAAKGLFMAALLSGLYALLFSLLRMEDFALLVGTGLVLAMMGVLMYVTRGLKTV